MKASCGGTGDEADSGMSKDDIVVITISGRGDKDVKSVARFMGVDIND